MAYAFIHNEDAHSLFYMLPAFGACGRGDFGEWLKRLPDFPHGEALLNRMLDRRVDDLALEKTDKQTLRELLSYGMEPDEGLGCLPRAWRGMYLEALQEYAHVSREPAAVVQLDFRNMANTNDALGRKQVNRLMRVVTGIFERTLSGVDATGLSHAGVTTLRPGGDEVEFYVTKLSPGEVRERMELAHRAVEAFLAEVGTVEGKGNVLSRLAYKKNPQDRHKTGFGIGIGCVMLGEEVQSVKQIQDALDEGIHRHKEQTGAERARHMEGTPLTAGQVRSFLSAATVEHALARAEKKMHYEQGKPERRWPETLPLPEMAEGRELDLYEAQKAALNTLKRTMTEPQALLVDRLGHLVNTRDPMTEFKAARSLPRSMDYLREHSRHGLVLAEVELSNLVTLNKELKTDGANAFLSAMNNRVILPELQKELGDAFFPARDIYYAGGSRMRLLLRDIPIDEVNAKLQRVSQRIEEDINQRPLGEVLDALGLKGLREMVGNKANEPCTALLHPKKEARSIMQGSEPRQGVELLFGAMNVERGMNSSAVISLLEALKEAYEERPMLVRQQINEQQEFVKTPQCAWAVGNGKDNTGVILAVPAFIDEVVIQKNNRLPGPLYVTLAQEMRPTPSTTVGGRSESAPLAAQGQGWKKE